MLIFMTAIPKVPAYAPEHPGGGEAFGEMACVTPCGKGDASTAAARARRADEYLILKLTILCNSVYDAR